MRWYTKIGRRVWLHEVAEFIFRTKLLRQGPTLQAFLGDSLEEREYALAKRASPAKATVHWLRPADDTAQPRRA